MNRITSFFEWAETRLDEGGWVRRAYLVAATVLAWKVTHWSMSFAETTKLAGVDAAAVIAAVGAPVMAVLTFAFNSYLESRK